jgi:hypothetical protein
MALLLAGTGFSIIFGNLPGFRQLLTPFCFHVLVYVDNA